MTPDLYRAALDRDRPEEALDVALAAWRETRHPSVAGAVRAASRRAIDRFGAPGGRTKELFHAAWREVAGTDASPVATGWLASRLEHLLPMEMDRYAMIRPGGLQERHAPLYLRIGVLVARGPDPRIADALVQVLRDGRYGFWDMGTTELIYRPVLDALLLASDPGAGPTLRALAADPRVARANLRQWMAQELPLTADELEALPVTAPDVEWAALGVPEEAPPVDVSAYLAAVYEDPTDEGARAVLSDVLQQAGDPRGELIALQLSGAEAQGKRARQLLRAHQDEWLGPELAPVLGGVMFRRGFLEEAELRQNAAASPEGWARAVADPRLATVRVLLQGRGNKEHYGNFVRSPAMRDLRRVEVPTSAFLDELAAGPPRTIEALVFPKAPNRKALSRVATSSALVNARGLHMPRGFDVLALVQDLEATLLHQLLRELVVTAPLVWRTPESNERASVIGHFHAVVARLPALERLVVEGQAASVVFLRRGATWDAEVSRPVGYGSWAGEVKLPDGLGEVRHVDATY